MNIWKNRNWSPMLLKELCEPFSDENYIYEIKYDGIRAVCFATSSGVTIKTRNNNDITEKFPELQEIKHIIKKNVIFDGEIVVLDNKNFSFKKVMERLLLKNELKIKSIIEEMPVIFMCFDILYENKDLTNVPLIQRKKYLSAYDDTDVFIKAKYINKEGVKLFKQIQKLNLEGIVAKNINGKYHINERTDDFIKIKNNIENIFNIGGYKINKNNTITLYLGNTITLYLGNIEEKKLKFVGKCTVGKFSKIGEEIIKQKRSSSQFIDFYEDINFIKPNLKCKVKYTERTKSGLRHVSFISLEGSDKNK